MTTPVAALFAVMAVMVAGPLAWMAWQLTRLGADTPERLVGELRLSQAGATVLALTASVYAGLAAAAEHTPGASADLAMAGAFGAVSLLAHFREPRQALGLLAAAFAAHALFDLAHRPHMLPLLAPRWLAMGSPIFDLVLAVTCALPLVRRT